MSAALSESQRRVSSEPLTMPTTLKSSSAGSDAWTCSASTPGSTARRALTGRLGIRRLPQNTRGACGRFLRRLRARHRPNHKPELAVVGCPSELRDVLGVDAHDE